MAEVTKRDGFFLSKTLLPSVPAGLSSHKEPAVSTHPLSAVRVLISHGTHPYKTEGDG